MRTEFSRLARFLRSTATGGLIFLLPLAVLLALLGQVYSIVLAIAKPLHDWIPVYTPLGISLLFLAALAILVLLCFMAGLAAQRVRQKVFVDDRKAINYRFSQVRDLQRSAGGQPQT